VFSRVAVRQTPRDILECIGHTSLVPLRHIVAPNGSRVLLKLEKRERNRQHEGPDGAGDDRSGNEDKAGDCTSPARRC